MTITSNAQKEHGNDKPSRFVVPTKNSSGLWGAVNSDGSLRIAPIYKTLFEFDDDASLPSPFQAANGKWGYLNRDGVIVHAANLDSARVFSVERLARFEKDGLWGFIAPNGEYAIEPIYKQASYFHNGYARVELKDGWSFIDTTGKLQTERTFARLEDFSPAGLALAVKDRNSDYGYIDTQGNWAIKAQFEDATSFGKANRASVRQNEKWGVINEKGEWVVKPAYEKMDEFGDKNFTAFYVDWDKGGLIDTSGNITFDHRDKRFYSPRYYTQCDVVTMEDYGPNFFDLNGKPLEQLNSPNYRLFSGFDSHCNSLALSGDNATWTRLKGDGTRDDFPKEVQEPHFSWAGESTVLTLAAGSFIPVTLKDRNLAYLNDANEIALRTNAVSSAQEDTFIVSDANGEEIWRQTYDHGTLIENNQHRFFLTKGNLEFGYDKPTKENITQKIEQLKQKPAGPFEASYGYDIDSGEGESFGSGVRLADAWYAYYDHGSTYYHAIDWPDFTPQFTEVKGIIESLLGSAIDDDETIEQILEDNDIYGTNQATWMLDKSVLVLHDTYYEDGDVDYWASLNLLLLPTKDAKSSLTGLTVVAPQSLSLSAQSSPAISAAVAELRSNFEYNSAEGLRRLAVSVLDIAQGGEAISPDDYLWAQYGQLFAVFYDGAEEPQVGTNDEYVAIAINTLDFLDDNDIGKDRLTAAGQTRLKVYRYAANGAAWILRESDPEQALKLIERGIVYARPQDTYLQDTKVRILLNLDRQQDAFMVVKEVLDENPWFEYFNDFTEDKAYKKWVKKQGGKFVAYDDIPSTSKHLQENQTIAVNTDANKLAVYWNDELQLFDLRSGKPLFSVNTGTYHPFTMTFNIDGSELISSGWDEVAIWNTTSGKKTVKRTNKESNSNCAGFSATKGEYFYESELFGGSNNLTISNYANKSLLSLGFGHNCNTSNDNRMLAVNGKSEDDRDQIQIIDLEKHKVIAKLVGEQATPYDDDLFFVQDNAKLLVRDYSNFHLWNIQTKKVESSWDTDSFDVDEVVVTNEFVFILDADQLAVRLWRFGEKPSDNISLAISEYANGGASYRGFKVNESKTQYVVATKNKDENLKYIFLFDFNTHKLIKEFVVAEDFGEIFFNNNDQHLVLDSYPIQILDLKSGEVVHRIRRSQ